MMTGPQARERRHVLRALRQLRLSVLYETDKLAANGYEDVADRLEAIREDLELMIEEVREDRDSSQC